ncbi:hypothetical protein T12_12888 [Trichinella patagoniensis]|uniref:Uncharacterized protein n=1 Tax=Trichinella patagoniensis TaxID=990121 RepID=A0A0V0ZID8_9BILA|nr:hypothetical protein T12_12888 [Trichinella patagoniensis]
MGQGWVALLRNDIACFFYAFITVFTNYDLSLGHTMVETRKKNFNITKINIAVQTGMIDCCQCNTSMFITVFFSRIIFV